MANVPGSLCRGWRRDAPSDGPQGLTFGEQLVRDQTANICFSDAGALVAATV